MLNYCEYPENFQRWGMQVRCTTQTFAHCPFANQAVRAQKQAEKTSERKGSLDASLWNHSVGNRLCASFSFSMMFSFLVWVHWLPLPLLKILFLWTPCSCFTGKQSHGSTSKKASAPRVLASGSLSWGLPAYSNLSSTSHCWQQWVCQLPVSLSVRSIIRASPTFVGEGNYSETYVAIGT